MDFSPTERGTFKRCRRQAVLTSKNGQHLTPLFGTLALSTGSVVHRAHQLWLNDSKSEFSLEQHTLTASNEATDRATRAYVEKVGCKPSDEEQAPLYEAIDFCMSMATNYEVRYGSEKLPDRYRFISAEQKVRIPVPDTEHRCEACSGGGCKECDGNGIALHYLKGRLDGFIQDVETGVVGVLERKTYKNRPKEEVLRRVDQFKAYEWMVNQLKLTNIKGSVSKSFVLYDGLWRRKEVPRGRTFEDLFARYVIKHTEPQMAEFERFLAVELNEMASVYAEPSYAYTTVPWMGCGDCGMLDLCDAMTGGTDSKGRTVDSLLATRYTARTDDEDEVEAAEVED